MTTQTEPRTIRVRIAVAVDRDGQWSATGFDDVAPDESAVDVLWQYQCTDRLADDYQAYWITADVPLPVAPTIEGTVIRDDAD